MKDLTIENIEEQHKLVLENKIYGKEFRLIQECFNKYPLNNDKNIIAFKIGLLDITNSTNISRHKSKISVYELVDIIYNINFDKRIKIGDEELVNDIAKTNGKINLFSFASKYCCYHNNLVYGKDDYSIFDSIIRDYFPRYNTFITKWKLDKYRKNKNYAAFNKCIGDFLDLNNINIENRRRKFDHFIWNQFR